MKNSTKMSLVLFLSILTSSGYASGQDRLKLDPNELVRVRREDIAKCRRMSELWEEKSTTCDQAAADAKAAQKRADDYYQRNVELIEKNAKLREERDTYARLAIGGALVSAVLTIIVVYGR